MQGLTVGMYLWTAHTLCSALILTWTLVLVRPSKMSKDKIREIYEFFFKYADADGDGLVSGPDAAAMFRKSGITDETLRSVRPFCIL